MKNSKRIGLIIGMFLFALLIVGSTMAYWIWRGQIANVGVTGYTPFNCAVDGGIHASTVSLMPAACTHDRYAIQREITVDHELFSPNTSVYMDMILNVNNIGTGLAGSSNFKYALTKSSDSCTKDVVSSGTFKNITNGTTINLFDDRIFDYSQNTENKYYLYIWIDSKEENRNILNQNFNFSLDLVCTQGYESGAQMLVNKANDSSITTYSSGNTKEMYAFSQPETEQLSATTDYRYIGSSPNNYIIFNNELWRIIGVFDGKIKIIRDNIIGRMPWDYKSNLGSSTTEIGSNDWQDSQLMYMLNVADIAKHVNKKDGYTYNGTYVKDNDNDIIYQKGCMPSLASGTGYSCTLNSWSLSDSALMQVVDINYYLGAGKYDSTKHWGSLNDIYSWERGTYLYDTVRSINWTGKVGLMYPSDYGYTFAYNVDNKCYSDLFDCNSGDGGVPTSSWLHISNADQLCISSRYLNPDYIFGVANSGSLYDFLTNSSYSAIRPVVYLKDSTLLIGDGTSRNPYVISTADSYIENTASLQDGAATLVNKANGINITSYSAGDTGEMYTFQHPKTKQVGATIDYRYIGSNPKNYITFNNETWRIIGVFDGRIKIIRNESIGNVRWDAKQSGVGSSASANGSNDWVDSQLMYMLNSNDIAFNVIKKKNYSYDGTYVKDANGKIIYKKGCNPASTDGTSYSCTTNSWSLNGVALSQISDVTYYIAGSLFDSTLHYGSVSEIYAWERGIGRYNDVRSRNWTGKVGLIYPSDYIYTFAYGVDSICYDDIYICNSGNPMSSWLSILGSQWTISQNIQQGDWTFMIDSNSGGIHSHRQSNNSNSINPVVYLKSDIKLTGTGTVDDKYTIVS